MAQRVAGFPIERKVTLPSVPRAYRIHAPLVLLAVFGVTLETFWRFTPRPPIPVPLTPFDAWIPFWGPAVYVYLSYFPFFAAALWTLRRQKTIDRAYAALLLAWFAALACNVLQPTLCQPQDLSELSGLTRRAMAFVNFVDDLRAHGNSFPSTHVAVTWIVALAWGEDHERWKPAMFLYALAITLSTQLTKQHYLVDAAGGLALAFACRWVVARWVEFRGA